MEQINEEWRPIDDYEGLYEVSSLGRVRSIRKGIILKPEVVRGGYLQVGLHKKGKVKGFKVHRLVAQAFIPNPEGLPEINHIDEDKTNNLVDNIEYCDSKYNCNYGTRNERIVQTGISNGIYDPELCGIGDEKEYARLHMRKYRQKNRDRILEYKREYRQKNREKLNEQARLLYHKNLEKMRERQRERMRKYRLKKKQEEKDNRQSGESLW